MYERKHTCSSLAKARSGRRGPCGLLSRARADPVYHVQRLSLYDYLRAELEQMRLNLGRGQQAELEIGFSAAGQLKVSWQGRPSDNRKTVLIAHVDREGFLVRRFDESLSSAVCWHAAWTKPEPKLEPDKIGSPVKLFSRHGTMRGTITGMSKTERPISTAEPFNHEVQVRIDERQSKEGVQILNNPYSKALRIMRYLPGIKPTK